MNNYFSRLVIGLFIGASILLLYRYQRGYDDSIEYYVTTSAETTEFVAYPFTKGPFQFSFKGEAYSLAESFAAGPIVRDINAETGFLALILLGLCLILATVSSLPRWIFTGVMALFIFFIISLNLDEVGLFGLSSDTSTAMIILLILFVVPTYLFHAFFTEVSLSIRFVVFALLSAGIVYFGGVPHQALVDQFTVGSHFGLALIGLLFLFLIAEENVFAILFLITKSKGGKNNHLHFIVFSLVYLGIIGLYYGKKSGILQTEVAFFDPFILLTISGIVSLWTFIFKNELLGNLLSIGNARMLLAALGIVTLGFLSLAMYRGNDAVYESFHYLIVYAHLAFGAFFFIYILVNFLTPLIEGLIVYKVAYKSQNFPYTSARLGGLVAIAAFFFLADKEALQLLQAGRFNYIGAQTEAKGESLLAGEYYRQGAIFGHDNHYSNYKLGYRELQKGDTQEANFRFTRAATRYPSPQAFISKSSTYAVMSEATPSLVSLKEGLREFPANPQLQNNLGLTYADQGKTKEAIDLLSQADLSGEWTNANLVNLWKLQQNAEQAQADFENGNLAVKANVLHSLLKTRQEVPLEFDTADLYPSYPLHRMAFLINASWYFQDPNIPQAIYKALSVPVDEEVYWRAKIAAGMSQFGLGQINNALRTMDQLVAESRGAQKARILNQMGLIALSQHTIDEALRFFEQAIAEGNEAAFLNKAACLLEQHDLDEAISWSEYLMSIDSGFAQLHQDLTAIRSAEGLSEDQHKMRLYYFYENYTNAEISSALATADDAFLLSIWTKISRESLLSDDPKRYQKYRTIFQEYLNPELFIEPDMIVQLNQGKTPQPSNHPVSQLLQVQDSSKFSQIAQLVGRNAYNEPLVLAVANYLQAKDESAAYQLLVECVDINKSSVPLRKQYVLTAIRTGLPKYAKGMLVELERMMSTPDYNEFQAKAQQLKSEVATDSWN